MNTTAKATRSHRVNRPACAGGRRLPPHLSIFFPRMTKSPRADERIRRVALTVNSS